MQRTEQTMSLEEARRIACSTKNTRAWRFVLLVAIPFVIVGLYGFIH